MEDTERLQFRKYTKDDLEFLYSMTSNPNMMRYIGKGVPWTLEETEQGLERFISRYGLRKGIGLMMLINKNNGVPIGHAGLVPQVIEGKAEIEVGYWIKQDFWGHGYAVEAARACRDYGFYILKRERLISIIQHENIGSKNVAQKIGMAFEREVNFNSKNVALYAIDKEKFTSSNKQKRLEDLS